MTTTSNETIIEIPCGDIVLPGTLFQAQPGTRSKNIALLLHGQMAHRNQLYHKKLVKALAEERNLDSFRFDFSHAHYGKPGWYWHMANFQRDVEELKTVVEYLESQHGYKVALLIAHSKGALASFIYLCKYPNPPPFYVNLSGRYNMKQAEDIVGPRYYPEFQEKGYFEWKAKVAGQQIAVKVTPDQFEAFTNHDTSFVNTQFPSVSLSLYYKNYGIRSDSSITMREMQQVEVLTVHGDADPLVPVENGRKYHDILSKRLGPGSSTLHIVKGADHNFLGHFDEVVETIMTWLSKVDTQKSRL